MSKQNQVNYCYFNGKIAQENKVGFSVNDISITRGCAIFTTMRAMGNRPFLLDEHYERVKSSSAFLGIKFPFSKPALLDIIKKLISKNQLVKKESTIKIVVTGGECAGWPSRPTKPTICILNHEFHPFPPKIYKDGVKLITLEHQRQFPEIKTTSYVAAVKAYNEKMFKEKAFEVLYISDGKVLECTTSNFFIIKNGVLITAKNNILLGTTRNLVIKLAGKEFKIEERDVYIDELATANEAFLTATNKEIVPVVKIDHMVIGNGLVGKKTKKLMEMLRNYIKNF